jgi:cysteine desulfurase
MIYLDNNATTIMPAVVKTAMIEWCNRGNPSAGYASAKEARAMMNDLRLQLGRLCGFDACCPEKRDGGSVASLLPRYNVIFTSGASEANATVLHGVVAAHRERRGHVPHIVMSAIEHKSLLDMAKSYESRGIAAVTFVKPTPSGHIRPEDVAAAILPHTCLVCVMHANNETGAINDVAGIATVAHQRGVAFHCDTVQTFGKGLCADIVPHVDSFCVSFHKLHGPPGVGALIIRQELLDGYKMPPLIFGTQCGGMRGGTENLPGIGAAAAATTLTMTSRTGKNTQLSRRKQMVMTGLAAQIRSMRYTEYVRGGASTGTMIVFMSASSEYYLCNTILLSVVNSSKEVCNVRLKEALEAAGVVVSVGSACNTASSTASHVLYAMGADDAVRRGALRISLGDDTTDDQLATFVRVFIAIIKKQVG